MDQDAHGHDHEHEGEEMRGVGLGVRFLESEGEIYYVEAEISPYVDSPDELGVTLVFQPLDELAGIFEEQDVESPSWPVDIDDDLKRDPSAPIAEQFKEIVRQLARMTQEELAKYLEQAREESGLEEEG